MNKLWPALTVLLVVAPHLQAQLEEADAKIKAGCATYAETPLPAEAGLIAAPKEWPTCASYKLYSGIGVEQSLEAARKCAWSERLAVQNGLEPRYTVASVFGGSAMLTQIYANGAGVPQNLPLALRFACEAGGAPAEITGRFEHLEKLKTPKEKKAFDFCDDITSGFMMGFCAGYASEIAQRNRDQAMTELTVHWTDEQKAAFSQLESAKEQYVSAHGRGEVDLSGTARAMFQIEEQDGIRDSFAEALKSFEKGALPKASPEEATEADDRLNREYKKRMDDALAHKGEYGALKPEGIRGAERAWIQYRDAWIAFAKIRYPSISESAWLKLLSDDRVLVLQGKCCGVDPEQGKDATSLPRPLP